MRRHRLLEPYRPLEIMEDGIDRSRSYLLPEIPKDGADHQIPFPSPEVRGVASLNSSARGDAAPDDSSLTLRTTSRLSLGINANPGHSASDRLFDTS
ncbi:hypothetical protein BHE74_00004775 [Ensete ventricosum]|nr:hypothetical protein GW17_00008557 [Ensete ventricosum]RWW86448.1 hypothetical protein BHE74_00004775 [Ensete ventricosum]RZR76968.1 hypothetical protein BHM03_00001895 [Ensete ventricosum]